MVVDTNDSEKPPLILIHAIGLDHRMWSLTTEKLSERFRVIAYDLRGHGDAPANGVPISLEQFSDDLLDLMNEKKLDRVHLAGLSIGGSIGQVFALRHPDRVTSLTLICTTATAQPAFELRAQAAERDGMRSQVFSTITRWFSPSLISKNPWAVRYARDQVAGARVKNWAASWRALARIATMPRLGELAMPVHFIAGECDPSTTPEAMRKMADRVSHSSFQIIPEGRHMLSLENPDQLVEAMFRH